MTHYHCIVTALGLSKPGQIKAVWQAGTSRAESALLSPGLNLNEHLCLASPDQLASAISLTLHSGAKPRALGSVSVDLNDLESRTTRVLKIQEVELTVLLWKDNQASPKIKQCCSHQSLAQKLQARVEQLQLAQRNAQSFIQSLLRIQTRFKLEGKNVDTKRLLEAIEARPEQFAFSASYDSDSLHRIKQLQDSLAHERSVYQTKALQFKKDYVNLLDTLQSQKKFSNSQHKKAQTLQNQLFKANFLLKQKGEELKRLSRRSEDKFRTFSKTKAFQYTQIYYGQSNKNKRISGTEASAEKWPKWIEVGGKAFRLGDLAWLKQDITRYLNYNQVPTKASSGESTCVDSQNRYRQALALLEHERTAHGSILGQVLSEQEKTLQSLKQSQKQLQKCRRESQTLRQRLQRIQFVMGLGGQASEKQLQQVVRESAAAREQKQRIQAQNRQLRRSVLKHKGEGQQWQREEAQLRAELNELRFGRKPYLRQSMPGIEFGYR